ncbi:Glutamine--tRNA ligase [Buchnera aphidicola (Pterocallis alni)]|uniref:glutamine--tRNA ligase n=1 Tax=Buchnera aphidicola TaxID=9 RepID=UPI003463CCBC
MVPTKTKYKNNFIHQVIKKDFKKNRKMHVKTRFPPDPNGYLHIGHAKSICLNFDIAKIYLGICNLRFDDTNPNKEHSKYMDSIKNDIAWLGFKWNQDIKYTSMYFNIIYYYALELIKKKLAYVDQLTKEEIKQYRGTLTQPGKNSPYRNQTVQENMFLFKQMQLGKIPEGKACLRAKIDMKSSFMVMRDPVLYRIKFKEHHHTKKLWCIYPTYDFSHCISDAIEGITHSLCTLEFQDNKQLYNWILNHISIHHRPTQYEYSRLNIEYSILSKRKLQLLIQQNIVQRWDDPRLLTISGLRRKGYTAQSIRNFCNNIGVTKQNNLIEISALEACIRDELNKTAHRTMAILDPIEVIIYNIPNNFEEKINILNHPNNIKMGTRDITFNNKIYIERSDFQETPNKKYKRLTLGGSVKLKYAYNITARYIKKDKNNNIIKIFCTCNLKNKNNKRKNGIIHWITKTQCVKSRFMIYNNLFNTKNPENKKNLLPYINKNSIIKKYGFVHHSVLNNKQIQTYQFERIGYFYIDSILSKKNILTFNQTVSLKQNKKPSNT